MFLKSFNIIRGTRGDNIMAFDTGDILAFSFNKNLNSFMLAWYFQCFDRAHQKDHIKGSIITGNNTLKPKTDKKTTNVNTNLIR